LKLTLPFPRAPRRRSPAASQRGLTLLGLIITGVVLVFVAMIVMKVFPTATEYLAVKRAVVKAQSEGTDPLTIRNAFDRAAAIDDITSITGKDLDIQRIPGGGFTVSFAYEKRIPLFGPAILLLDYRGDARDAAPRR